MTYGRDSTQLVSHLRNETYNDWMNHFCFNRLGGERTGQTKGLKWCCIALWSDEARANSYWHQYQQEVTLHCGSCRKLLIKWKHVDERRLWKNCVPWIIFNIFKNIFKAISPPTGKRSIHFFSLCGPRFIIWFNVTTALKPTQKAGCICINIKLKHLHYFTSQ